MHDYDRDGLGRQVEDRVTTVGTGISAAVRRIVTTFDIRGMQWSVKCFDNPSVGSGTVLNEVQMEYNDFRQLSSLAPSRASSSRWLRSSNWALMASDWVSTFWAHWRCAGVRCSLFHGVSQCPFRAAEGLSFQQNASLFYHFKSTIFDNALQRSITYRTQCVLMASSRPVALRFSMIVLLGSSGFIGSAFAQELRHRGIPFRTASRADLDYYCVETLVSYLRAVQASFLINAAGYTGNPNVDDCESNRGECLLANSVLPDRVRQACDAVGIRWGHVSSGCIYNGESEKHSGFTEADSPNFTFRSSPCSFYAGTKALAEELLSSCDLVYLWRLRMPFTNIPHQKNYLTKLMSYERLLNARNSITCVEEFVSACVDCWIKELPTGIYNLTNTGAIVTAEVTEIIRVVLRPQQAFHFFADEREFMEQVAVAPRSNCVLDNSKALSLGLRLSDTREAIRKCLVQMAKVE